jgi:hypothetical protein
MMMVRVGFAVFALASVFGILAGCDEMGRSRRSKHPEAIVDGGGGAGPWNANATEAGPPVNPLFAPQPGDTHL